MKNKNLLTLSLLATALSSAMVVADPAPAPVAPALAMNEAQVENIIHEYLVHKHPEVLIEASQTLQSQQTAKLQEQAKSAIAEHGTALVGGTLTVAGNPKGDVTLVEFFDYQCSHCKNMKPVINELIKKNPKLRVVFKEFPIFGKESELAARAAIVAGMQGKYMKFQNALFKADKHLDEETIMAAAKKVGLNMRTLKTDMQSKAVSDVLAESHKLAESIHLMGTPAFVLLATPDGQFKPGLKTVFIPGASSEETLQEFIAKLEKQEKK
jgi:protein-disulfide isomerase